MAQIKTQQTTDSVADFIASIPEPQKRADSQTILDLMAQATGEPPALWGPSIVGFGRYHYRGKSSEGEWFHIGFSPRKQNLTLYLGLGAADSAEAFQPLLDRLGKHTTGKGCLYVKRLADVDPAVLQDLIQTAARQARLRAAAS